MVRKQVYITAEQEERLKRRAAELGVPEAELIRRGLDLVLDGWTGAPLDSRLWEQELAFIRGRVAQDAGTGREDRGWTREELYAERLDRLSR